MTYQSEQFQHCSKFGKTLSPFLKRERSENGTDREGLCRPVLSLLMLADNRFEGVGGEIRLIGRSYRAHRALLDRSSESKISRFPKRANIRPRLFFHLSVEPPRRLSGCRRPVNH